MNSVQRHRIRVVRKYLENDVHAHQLECAVLEGQKLPPNAHTEITELQLARERLSMSKQALKALTQFLDAIPE